MNKTTQILFTFFTLAYYHTVNCNKNGSTRQKGHICNVARDNGLLLPGSYRTSYNKVPYLRTMVPVLAHMMSRRLTYLQTEKTMETIDERRLQYADSFEGKVQILSKNAK